MKDKAVTNILRISIAITKLIQIVKELLMRNQSPPVTRSAGEDEEDEWAEDDILSEETLVKIEGLKMMARWLLGLKEDIISAQKTFRMLNAFILHKGDLLESNTMPLVERIHYDKLLI